MATWIVEEKCGDRLVKWSIDVFFVLYFIVLYMSGLDIQLLDFLSDIQVTI